LQLVPTRSPIRNSSIVACASSCRRNPNRATIRWLRSISSDSVSRSINWHYCLSSIGAHSWTNAAHLDDPLDHDSECGSLPAETNCAASVGERFSSSLNFTPQSARPARARAFLLAGSRLSPCRSRMRCVWILPPWAAHPMATSDVAEAALRSAAAEAEAELALRRTVSVNSLAQCHPRPRSRRRCPTAARAACRCSSGRRTGTPSSRNL